MDVVLQILLQLGANQTVFIQFIIFVITISFLTVVVYGPYFKAYDQRLDQTKGADQVAGETQEEAKKLELIYQSKAREINDKIKNIFDASKKSAGEQVTQILNAGKNDVAAITEKARVEIESQKSGAQKEVARISQEVAAEISKKITGAT